MKAKFTYSFWTSSETPKHGISLAFEDPISNTTFFKVNLTVEDFANAVLGNIGYKDCDIEILNTSLIGKRREDCVKNVVIRSILCYGLMSKEDIECQLARYEVDGWIGDWKDAINPRRIIKHFYDKYLVRVTFIRYVEVENGQEALPDL